ncbi:MAG: DUF5105 domain-containing protein [Erysipelotrichia bacterium]|nr:DUF5105 domain-containing protein [Erysipelotrichia bacterium]
MKNILKVLLVLSMIITLTACGEKPEKVVKTFLNNCKSGNLTELYAADEDNTMNDEQYAALFKTIFSKMSYKIKTTEMKSDNEAIVTTEITTIDMSSSFKDIINDYLNWVMGKVFSSEDLSEEEVAAKLSELLNTALERNKDKTITFTVDIRVTKDNNGKWQIDFNNTLMNALTGGFYDSLTGFSID